MKSTLIAAVLALASYASAQESPSAAALRGLKSSDAMVRENSAWAIGRLGMDARPAVPELLNTLAKDESSKVRQAAAWSLGSSGACDKDCVPGLWTALKDDSDSAVRALAAEGLGGFGSAALAAAPSLEAALGDAGVSVRVQAARALERVRPSQEPLEVLLERPASATAPRLMMRVWALASAAPKDARATNALVEALTDSYPDVRIAAAMALARPDIGEDALKAVRRALRDKEKYVRSMVAGSLGKLGPAAASAVPDLLKAAGDPDKDVRISAVWALGAIGPAAASATKKLEALLKDPDPAVRGSVAAALDQVRPKKHSAGP